MFGAAVAAPLLPVVAWTAAFAADLVAGAANTEAGIALVEKLCDLKALDLLDKRSAPDLRAILRRSLGL